MITSINLSTIPFLSQTDSTRLQMSSKQIQQSLTSLNCDIPYVCSEEYNNISYNSQLGIIFAVDDGKVIFKDTNIIIVMYENLQKLETFKIPPFKKCSANYASQLRFALPIETSFKKNDIIFEYDNFINGIPTFGYNTNTAFMPFFSYNHEDSIVVSENFVDKTKSQYIEKVFIPITEYTILQKNYINLENSFEYFPGVGQQIEDDILACFFIPKNMDYLKTKNPSGLKSVIKNILKSVNVSDLINMESQGHNKLIKNKIKTKVKNGTVNGFKIHRLKKDVKLLDIKLQEVLERLCTLFGQYILEKYNDMSSLFNVDYIKRILKEHYIYNEKNVERGKLDLREYSMIHTYSCRQS